ncbi:zf-DHHC-domain-containing protein [Trematosphaeria pertusa]|uniref:Palmitoyltransferase PFA4 n=1 Tax=Trematosphaeria pertusa TaxID=390896 RepID=A0A6A6IVC2_9PLEO|nr:zf-DHHC-domain-containing protein [Trematosphaeria pertusa]KAF2253143.1 zf-DHHC-domain-containing protein [Trematosphaeria pertusa]
MELNQVAVPAVYALISFLGYPSQILLSYLDPGPLTKNELILSNTALVLIYITYTKSVFVDPGRIPKGWEKKDGEEPRKMNGNGEKKGGQSRKWCRKCDAPKPPRTHHCKECKRCIPKMDHHCPWTANCVSHTTFPHFLRFLFYATCGLSLLAYFLWIRISTLWANRNLPAYLGPSPWLVAHLFIATVANSITLFALGVLFIRNIWCLAVNTTTIEGWEIERHRTLVRRARHFGGWLDGPDGAKVRIEKQEFPYDIGIWKNIKQGMGTGNPLSWFNPFAPTPTLSTGLSFETNGFDDPSLSWPPPDPDRSYRRFPQSSSNGAEGFTYSEANLSSEETIAAFRERQAADAVRRRKPFLQRVETKLAQERRNPFQDELEYGSGDEEEYEGGGKSGEGSQSGEEGWRNSEGERLKDFGVDEEVEFYDEQEDDVPLGELLARKREAASAYQ